MIKAFIFDLDGTLIQTEILKARSYARALHLLTNRSVAEKEVTAVFNKYVGLSRAEVAQGLTTDFLDALKIVFPDKSTEELPQIILSRRLEVYDTMINDPRLLSNFFCPYSTGLLQKVHQHKFQTALATMSNKTEVDKVLDVMKIRDKLHIIVTRDQVSKGKPDPEIYHTTKDLLHVKPEECIVIEDSVNGIKAGIEAGMQVFAVTNSLTRVSVHDAKLLPDQFIVDDLTDLDARVFKFIVK